MPKWTNWSGKLSARPETLHFLRSEEDARALAQAADRSSATLRVAGATHSHAPLIGNNDTIVDASALAGVIDVDADARVATVWAGSRIFALGPSLGTAGLALHNQGDIDQQAIAGATATGTHGTGARLANLSSAVVGARLVLASGDIVDVDANNEPDLWQASRLHLGAFGIVTRLRLKLRESYRLAETAWTASLETVMADVDRLIADNRHFEFFWNPQTDEASAKAINETTEPPIYPIGEEGTRRAWSYEVLPNHRPHAHTEMEYSVPAEEGPACMAAIARLLTTKFTDVRWPVEYRTLAADDVWLSTAYERDTVTISVHQGIDEDDEPYFRACEEIFLCSKDDEEELFELQNKLNSNNNVFIGQSGVGKSSLVKTLLGKHEIKTRMLSERTGLGQHTTSTSRLYLLDNDGCLIDSPGIRDFDLGEVDLIELQQGFREFALIEEPCKFRDCVHNQEPGCVIRNAVDTGKISSSRYQNYLALAEQLELIR